MEKSRYVNISTGEIVEDFMAEDYVLDKLGLDIMAKAEHGGLTMEQQDFLESTIEWFFSGNWVEEKIEE